jgi:hypothetical protein
MNDMKQMGRRGFVLASALLAALTIGGCATVQPWQRGRLADPAMVFDADSGQLQYMTHWQEAREGAAGGFGVQSGGCGCK